MRTALDTNTLSALWSNEPSAAGVVYAELLACPKVTVVFVDEFCKQTGIVKGFHLQDAVWIEAVRRFARYASRRRKAEGEGPNSMCRELLRRHQD